jgi:ribosome-binding factor A
MPKEFSRTRRLGEQFQRELARLIQQEMKDPRLGMVTVSGVEISRDLAYAKVFVTVMGDAPVVEDTLQTLQGAAGFLRTQLAHSVRVRTMPVLRFVYDESVARGARLSRLIDEAVAEDDEHH